MQEGGPGIAFDQGQGEDLEEIGIDKSQCILPKGLVAVGDPAEALIGQPGGGFDLGELVFRCCAYRRHYRRFPDISTIHLPMEGHPDDLIGLFIEAIVRSLVLDKKQDQEEGRDAETQPHDMD